jgi:hypothetical protein
MIRPSLGRRGLATPRSPENHDTGLDDYGMPPLTFWVPARRGVAGGATPYQVC